MFFLPGSFPPSLKAMSPCLLRDHNQRLSFAIPLVRSNRTFDASSAPEPTVRALLSQHGSAQIRWSAKGDVLSAKICPLDIWHRRVKGEASKLSPG